MAMPFACAPLLRIASIECFFGFSVCAVVDVVIISRIDCIQCVSCKLCPVREKERDRDGSGAVKERSKGDPNIRVWGVVISNRTDFSVVVVFCFVL